MNAGIPRDAPENPYAVDEDGDYPAPKPKPQRPPRGVYERGLAACREILAAHGAPTHGPYWKPPKDS